MLITYYTDDNMELVRNTFNIDDMLNTLLQHNLIDEITGNYSQDICNMCNNCTIILAKHLSTYFVEPEKIKICEGVFSMIGNHTWIKVNDIIFDVTLAQFIPSAPHLAISKDNDYYQTVKEYTLPQWISKIKQ